MPALAGLEQDEIVANMPRMLEPLPLFGAALSRILLPLPSGMPFTEFDAQIASLTELLYTW